MCVAGAVGRAVRLFLPANHHNRLAWRYPCPIRRDVFDNPSYVFDGAIRADLWGTFVSSADEGVYHISTSLKERAARGVLDCWFAHASAAGRLGSSAGLGSVGNHSSGGSAASPSSWNGDFRGFDVGAAPGAMIPPSTSPSWPKCTLPFDHDRMPPVPSNSVSHRIPRLTSSS